GSLAAGGLGIAGGTAVLGSLVAGPALLVMGAIVGAKANKDLEAAKANAVQASEICAQLESGALQCVSIRRRTYMFYSLLARLEAFLTPLLFKMDEILKNEGLDYSKYSTESKKVISSAASTTITIKSILDTAILTEEGELTEDSKILLDKIQ
ncbi:MAG: hypothetical protein MJ141_09165, partial [Clostridia bacterium]|nr:hypothetical protein [Clostridia bacterium]